MEFFSRIPRLVSPDAQFSDLFSSPASQDYLVSTTLLAVVISAIAIFWLLLLLLFKLLGPSRLCECGADVGLAGNDVQKPDLVALHAAHPLAAVRRYEAQAGRPYGHDNGNGGDDRMDMTAIDTRVTDTTSAVLNAAEQAAWVSKVTIIEVRVRNVRIAAAFFATLLIASSVLMVFFGLNELQSVSGQVQSTTTFMGEAFGAASGITESFVARGVLAVRSRDSLVSDLATELLCPNCDPQGVVLVTDPNVGELKSVPVKYMANTLSSNLQHLGDFGLSKVLNLQEALAAISTGFHSIADDVNNYAWFYPSAIALLSLMDAIVVIYLIGIVTAARERSGPAFQRIQTWVLLPLFVLLIIATTTVCSLFSVVTVMNADFCTGSASIIGNSIGTGIGSPDDSVAAILEATLYPTDPAYAAVSYFTQGCRDTTVDPFGDMHLLTTKINVASTAQNDFIRQVTAHDDAALADALGIGASELDAVLAKILDLDDSLSTLVSDTSNATAALDCPSLNGAYADVTYSGVCDAGSRALTWMLACLAAVVLSGLSIVTLRSSWRDVIDFVDPAEAAQHKGIGKARDPYYDNNSIYAEGVDVVEEELRASYDDEEDGMYDDDDMYDSRPYYR